MNQRPGQQEEQQAAGYGPGRSQGAAQRPGHHPAQRDGPRVEEDVHGEISNFYLKNFSFFYHGQLNFNNFYTVLVSYLVILNKYYRYKI